MTNDIDIKVVVVTALFPARSFRRNALLEIHRDFYRVWQPPFRTH